MQTGIIFGLISLICWGLSNSFAPVVIKKLGPLKTTFWRYIWELILFVPIFFYFYKNFNFDLKWILITFVIAFIGYIPVLTFYKGLEIGKLGIVAPVANSSIIFTVLLSIIFFKESLNPLQILSIILIIFGIILISLNFSDLKSSEIFQKTSGLSWALITCLLWGLVFFLFKMPVNHLGPIFTSILLESIIAVYAGVQLKIKKQSLKFEENKKLMLMVFLMGLFGAGGILMFNYGIQNYNVSLVVPIALANPIIAVVYGKFVYKESLKLQQIFAVLLIILGIIFISL